METITRIRREHRDGKPIKAIARDLRLSRNTVRIPVPVLCDAPDYRELTSWLATPYAITMDRCEQPDRLPSCNDWRPFVVLSPSQIETAVSASTAGVVVSLMGTALKLERVGAFTGLTYVTYTALSADGASAIGTMFVRVRPAETH